MFITRKKKSQFRTSTLVVVVVILCASVSVYADILGKIDVGTSGARRKILENFDFKWEYDSDFSGAGGKFLLVGPVFPSEIGITKTLSPVNQDFDAFASFLTNGNDDALGHVFSGGIGSRESNWIDMYVESFGPDFYGYEITGITLTLNDLVLNTPGENPNGDGLWTDYSYDVTYSFYGELIPEPTTLLLLLGGLPFVRRKIYVCSVR